MIDKLRALAAEIRDADARRLINARYTSEGIADCLEAILAEDAGDGWLDISTAPRDGTRVLWCFDNGEFSKRRWTYCVIHWPEFKECYEVGLYQPLPPPPGAGP